MTEQAARGNSKKPISMSGATVLVIVLFLTEPVQYLPKAVLGAVIVSAAIGLIEPQAWRALASVDPVEVAMRALAALAAPRAAVGA